ncbi:RICIN domain-containing protein [Streptomyces sp. DI166]|uniref:RICIN domain-containing protein n=1 Tax=Streptomyces sp. DI166 TaxID=1839783 RepID=UPI000B87B13A|nr:RICIN domain-containing protein [Streptomyces sp. DI166]
MTPTDSDRDLVARLGPPGTGAGSVPLLMARHWRAAHEYAVICLATTGSAARMVTAAAFHRVLGNPSGEALRPQLLTAVRDTVKEWAADERISAALPELRKTTGARGMRAARSMTPERRRLAERGFGSLPVASRCLLWHIEVEAEPISIPAGLLGVDPGTAHLALDQAREQFRAACVRAHRELAPTRECGFHNRLLDVPIRRGGSLLPDVERHLTECRYCRYAAEQLSHFEGGLGELLAETVLGWGARRYLDSRPARAGDHPDRLVPARGGRHRPARQRPAVLPQGRAKVVAGVGLTTLALLATVLVSRGWSDDNGVPDPHATWGAPRAVTGRTATDPARAADELAHGLLRNLGTGLCLDLQGGEPRPGAATVLAGCSAAGSQQWSYRRDGRLRSGADPGLCLDSHASQADESTVVLSDCLLHPGAARYDLTVHGELLLRDDGDRAVAPGRDGKPTVTERDGTDSQRWQLGDGGTDRDEPPTPEPEERQDPYETRMARTEPESRLEPTAPVTRLLEAATTVTAPLDSLLS